MKENVKELARKIARLNSKDINDLQTALMENNISATMYRFNPAESMWDTQDHYEVHMVNAGRTKLRLVKTVKELMGLGLKEAKELVDGAPCVVKTCETLDEAELFEQELEDAGAHIKIKTI